MSDITDLVRTKKSQNTPSVSRRRKSEPYSRKDSNVLQPPMILRGEYNGSPITVYGEIHNMINNQFYEDLDLRNTVIFVEHATVLCNISKEDKYRLFNILKGSDWIWYKYKARNLPVVCVDNRIETGLPTSIEQKYALQTEDDVPAVVDCVMRTLRVFASPEIKEKFVRSQLTPVYIRFMKAIKEQMSKLIQEGSLSTETQKENKYKLIQNIMKLGGLLVDLHIIDQIKHYANGNKKPIAIFVGIGHVYRLHTLFNQTNIFQDMKVNGIPEEAYEQMSTLVYE